MKKVIGILSAFVFALAVNVSAQVSAGTPDPSALTITLEEVMVSSITIKEGSNTIPVPNGRGTIRLMKRGETFSNVVFTNAAGKATRLTPNNGSAENLPKPPCKYKLPDACFGSGSQNIGLCICRPTDLSNGPSNPYAIGLLLPAVQKVREAAARMSTTN